MKLIKDTQLTDYKSDKESREVIAQFTENEEFLEKVQKCLIYFVI